MLIGSRKSSPFKINTTVGTSRELAIIVDGDSADSLSSCSEFEFGEDEPIKYM